MSRPIDFCYDSLGSNPDLGYPNLSPAGLAPDEFDHVWPRCLPLRLLMYLQQFGFAFSAHLVEHAPNGSWYPVALSWHDFDCDYFNLVSPTAMARLRQGSIKLLFYYHEGDNPARIKQRFDGLCDQHGLDRNCYLFISANSSADQHSNFHYFNDHEYFFAYINRRQFAREATVSERPYEFTALNRIHKWWRASVMSDLRNQGILERSLWSYNTAIVEDDQPHDNPIRIDALPSWAGIIDDFIAHGPYRCDHADARTQNDHREVNVDLYTQSYCGLVIETLFDVDQSGGSFLTEKTYKCIKFGQPFVIIGPVGSLAVLRQAGYRVFDGMIDNSYDTVIDNTDRWLAIRRTVAQIKSQNMHQWYLGCLDDVLHNQHNFATKNHAALDRLVYRLTKDHHSI